jgi:D-lactate dehydrogenase (cytochrome)
MVIGCIVLLWRDAPRAAHLRAMGEGVTGDEAPNPEATKAVVDLRSGLRNMFARLHAAHLQVGKFYAYREAMSPTAWSTLVGLKQQLDPKGLMNPGALGLNPAAAHLPRLGSSRRSSP